MRALFFLIAASALANTQRVGNYEISIRLPDGGLYAREEMEIELRIADLTRPDPLTGFAPVIRAVVEAQIDMPSMPSMPAYRETAHGESAPGDYGIHPTFAHAGAYRLRLAVKPPRAESPLSVEFALEVGDAVDPKRGRKDAPPARYTVELTTSPKRPKVGEFAELRFVFRDRQNPKAVFSAFETVHEALFHLIIVRADLGHFAHEHPQRQPDGSFLLRHRFEAGGDYRLFADVAPAAAGSQILTARMQVSGSAGEAFKIEAAKRETQRQTDNTLVLIEAGVPFPVRKTIEIPVQIRDAQTAQPASALEDYLGAKGHFLLVHSDGVTFVHSHPSDRQTDPGQLSFLTRFPKAGLYRGWIQVKRAGQLLTFDFVLQAGSTP